MFKVKQNENDEPKAIKRLKEENKKKQQKELKNKNEEIKINKVKDEIEKIKEKRKRKNKKFLTDKQIFKRIIIKRVILVLLTILILVLGIVFGYSSYKWKQLVTDMFVNESSEVKDTDGNTIARLGSERKKEKIAFEDIPTNLKNAYVSIEDERFYSHHGVDIKRTGSAILSYIFHFGSSSYGGSTITQQLVKNLTGDNTDSVFRKIKEWVKAYELEWYFSKDEILELYLNIIYVGPNIYGVQSGAHYYFNKDVQNLSLAECAFLAGINNSPNSYNPFGDADNSEKIKNRTKTVLAKMLELENISESEYNEAIEDVENGLNFKNGDVPSSNGIYSYHTDALISEIITDIASEKNISETFATNYIYLSGLTINSTQNTSLQEVTETEFEKKKYQIYSENNNQSQAAMVIIDQSTGKVLSCVGGLGEKDTARGLNRATQSVRQTGSSIKPIAVLAPALDKKIITGASIYDDTQKIFKDNYSPENYDGYLGRVTVRRALESSQNIPFVEIMDELTPKTSIKYLKKMGITSLTDKDENLSLALGGLDKGISPLQMASAYATIANGGVYIEPTFYTTIINKSGKKILETNPKKHRVFSKNVAYVLSELLTQPVLGSNGTATYCSISGMDVAAKTGTTDDNFDRWLCGYTPYYTAVTWFGYDQNETIYYNNQNPAGILWSNIMKNIHSNLQGKKFEKPSGVTEATICSDSGKKANTGCPNTYQEYFVWGTVPGECNEHSGSKIKNNSDNNNKNDNSSSSNSSIDNSDSTQEERNNVVRNENIMNNSVNNSNNSYNDNSVQNNSNSENRYNNSINNGNTNSNNSSINNSNKVNNNTQNNNSIYTNSNTSGNANSSSTDSNSNVINNVGSGNYLEETD